MQFALKFTTFVLTLEHSKQKLPPSHPLYRLMFKYSLIRLLKLLHVFSAISTKLTLPINCTSRRQGGYCIDIVFRDEYVNIVACVWVATKKSPYFSSFLSILSQEVCRLSHRLACKLDKEQYLLQDNESAMHAFSATTNFLS